MARLAARQKNISICSHEIIEENIYTRSFLFEKFSDQME